MFEVEWTLKRACVKRLVVDYIGRLLV